MSLSANDLLETYWQRAESVSDAIAYRVDIRRDTRFVNLGVRWNFGTGNAKDARNRTSSMPFQELFERTEQTIYGDITS